MRRSSRVIAAATSLAVLASCSPRSADTPHREASSPADVGWPGYNNGLDGRRFSTLSQIDGTNVGALSKVCSLKLGDDGPFQSGPLVVGDTLYVTTSHTTVALGAADCAVRWRSVYKPDEIEAWPVNRGAAYLDGRIFRGTVDGRVIALDAKTGAELWRTKVGEPTKGEAVPSAPVAWEGKLFVGLAVGDYGTRSRMLALDAATGREVWRFDTIPAGQQENAASWKRGASALTGGGATWTSYTIDPETAEIFIPVANPSPALAPGYRPGDNLYSDSLLVLNARTGALSWYYQLIANDGHDWDLAATAALYTDETGRRIALIGSKDGFAYGIDRSTHQLIFKKPVTTIKNTDAPITTKGTFICPGYVGGVEWNGPAYDPTRKAAYVGAVDWCAIYHKGKVTLSDGRPDLGGWFAPSGPATGWVTALDGATGRELWRYHADAPIVAGVTPTAGGVVLTGDISGNLLALDSADGRLLSKIPVGGSLAGGVVTYAVDGSQYVAVTSGNISKFTFTGSSGSPTIVVYGVGKPALGDRQVKGLAQSDVPLGQKTYGRACASCHGARGEGANGPKLTGIASRRSLADIIRQIKAPKGAMPTMYPAMLTDEEVTAVARYTAEFR